MENIIQHISRSQAVDKFNKDIDLMPHEGGQEECLLSTADITFFGGNRGGGKTGAIMFDPMYDILNPNFSALYLRKRLTDIKNSGGLWDKSDIFFSPLGAEGTKSDLTRVFPSGAKITMDHCNVETIETIQDRFQGLEIPAIYFDEITQFQFYTFMTLLESNRNTHGIRNRVICTCNPDPYSWVRTFLDVRYIDCSGGLNDGYIIPEMDKKIQYFYIYGKTVEDIIWGDTVDEVVEKCGDRLSVTDSMKDKGARVEDLIMSCMFIKGDIAENPHLMNDKQYLKNIGKGGDAAQARNFRGNWHVSDDGEEMVKRAEMDNVFDSERSALRSHSKYMTIDIALGGKDNATFYMFEGRHLVDIHAKPRIGSMELAGLVKQFMNDFGIREENVAFDAVGIGAYLESIYPKAYAIQANSPPIGTDNSYYSLKSQILYKFGCSLQDGNFTVNPRLRNKTFGYGKDKRDRKTFFDIMQNERRALKIMEGDGKTRMYGKKDMIKILGFSPDFLEGWAYIEVFFLDNTIKENNGLHYL